MAAGEGQAAQGAVAEGLQLPGVNHQVGQCIYCGSRDDLTDEHVLPFALGGLLVLVDGSCTHCAKITTKFEEVVCRRMFGDARLKLGFPTRRKSKKRGEVQVTYIRPDGSDEIVSGTPARQPAWYVVVHLPPPGLVRGQPPTPGHPEFKASVVLLDGERQESSSGVSLRGDVVFSIASLYRLLAKVAHGCLVYKIGHAGYTPMMPAVILGGDACPSYWIGGADDLNLPSFKGRLFDLQLATLRGYHYIVVRIQLPFQHVPLYEVIAGTVTDRIAFELLHGVREP